MADQPSESHYTPTEAKYKNGARDYYVTYDLEQRTRGGGTSVFPKVKRIYIAGDVKDWAVGEFRKRSGREAHGVRIEYEQERSPYHREGYQTKRGRTRYDVEPAAVSSASQRFTQVVEVPERATNVKFHAQKLPAKYQSARQDVR
jgi:hypothetical protein